MLAIRMQRTGRKGHPEFRVVVQDARLTPTSGRVVTRLGHYNPHTKAVVLDKEKTVEYLKNGAQPTPRVVRILQAEKVELPSWVKLPSTDKKRSVKNAEKLRKNQPAEEKAPEEETPVVEEQAAVETPEVAPAEESAPTE